MKPDQERGFVLSITWSTIALLVADTVLPAGTRTKWLTSVAGWTRVGYNARARSAHSRSRSAKSSGAASARAMASAMRLSAVSAAGLLPVSPAHGTRPDSGQPAGTGEADRTHGNYWPCVVPPLSGPPAAGRFESCLPDHRKRPARFRLCGGFSCLLHGVLSASGLLLSPPSAVFRHSRCARPRW